MYCKRCREHKKDMVRVDNLIICSDCINLIILEWDIKLMEEDEVRQGANASVAVRSLCVLRTHIRANEDSSSVKFTSVAA